MGDSKDGIGSDKEVDSVLSAILSKVNAVKGSLSSLVGKVEHEQLTWPSVLDSFSSFSGHSSNLMKQLGGDRLPPLHTRVILPLMVSSDVDYELERHTEGRVPMMHHEVVPNYLRTKLGLELEGKQKDKWIAASKEEGGDCMTKVKKFNQILSSALEHVREEEERKSRIRSEVQPNTTADTRRLVAMYLKSEGLAQLSVQRNAQPAGGGPMFGRNTAIRAAGRKDHRQMVAPYLMPSPHKHPLR